MKDEIYNEINLKIININAMQDSKEKDKEIAKLISYATYMYYTGNLEGSNYRLLLTNLKDKKRQDIINNYENNRIKNFIKYNDELINYFYLIYYRYQKYNLDYIDDYIDYKNISFAMNEFLKYLNIYDLFHNLLDNKMIGKSSIINESNLTINNYDNSYIVIGNFLKHNLLYYDLFVHEIGHAYVNKILKDRKIYNPNSLYKEIIPITFERIFIDYLKENNLINLGDLKRLIINEETMRLVELSYTLKTCDVLKNDEYQLINNDIFKINDIKEIYSFDYHYYAIANIVSIYLLNIYKQDKEKFINNLPSIINEISAITLKSVFSKYFDYNLITTYLENYLREQKIITK